VVFELTDKVAVVTGAASGIGLATARRFTAAGARVVLADVNDASAYASELHGLYVRTDVSIESDVRALMAEAARFGNGRINICVNNAGISTPALLVDADEALFERAFRVHTLGTLFGIKHAAGYMPPGSTIVNTASILGVTVYPGAGAYTASKFGVVGLTKTAAMELGERGIRVNCVCPTSVKTAMLAEQDNEASEVAAFDTMGGYRNLIEADEMAAAIHFLAAGDCGVISGHALVLDGGMTAGVSPKLLRLTDATLPDDQRPG
jgi:3alpha(or 20beta)-hydroxysteroid dehydrogenase